MADNTRQLKRRIKSAQNTSQITKAMEMVAASKMRKAQTQALASRAYSRALQQSLQKIAAYSDHTLHPFLQDHGFGQKAVVLVSTDKGLCGSLNTHLFKAATQWLTGQDDAAVIAVGKKAIHFARKLGLNLYAQFSELPDQLTTADTLAISNLVMGRFSDHTFHQIDIIYMDFINTLSQHVRTWQLLPLAIEQTEFDLQLATKEYTFEPEPAQLLKSLLPYYIENTVYQILLESKASEHSARMVAMKNASQNAKDLVKDLKLSYNRQRQAAITNELLDITTATLTLQP